MGNREELPVTGGKQTNCGCGCIDSGQEEPTALKPEDQKSTK